MVSIEEFLEKWIISEKNKIKKLEETLYLIQKLKSPAESFIYYTLKKLVNIVFTRICEKHSNVECLFIKKRI